MSIGSDLRHKAGQFDDFSSKPAASFSSDAIPYLLSTADAFIIVLSSLAGGIGYQLLAGNPMPDVLPHCAVGLLASFIHILRMRGSDQADGRTTPALQVNSSPHAGNELLTGESAKGDWTTDAPGVRRKGRFAPMRGHG